MQNLLEVARTAKFFSLNTLKLRRFSSPDQASLRPPGGGGEGGGNGRITFHFPPQFHFSKVTSMEFIIVFQNETVVNLAFLTA